MALNPRLRCRRDCHCDSNPCHRTATADAPLPARSRSSRGSLAGGRTTYVPAQPSPKTEDGPKRLVLAVGAPAVEPRLGLSPDSVRQCAGVCAQRDRGRGPPPRRLLDDFDNRGSHGPQVCRTASSATRRVAIPCAAVLIVAAVGAPPIPRATSTRAAELRRQRPHCAARPVCLRDAMTVIQTCAGCRAGGHF